MATECTSVKRKEGKGSGRLEKRGLVTRQIRLVGAEKYLVKEEDEADSLNRDNSRQGLKSNGAIVKVVRTGQRTVLVKRTEMEAPDVRDLEEVAKTPVTRRAHSKRVAKKPDALLNSTETKGKK